MVKQWPLVASHSSWNDCFDTYGKDTSDRDIQLSGSSLTEKIQFFFLRIHMIYVIDYNFYSMRTKIDNQSDYECITKTQHRNSFLNFRIIYVFQSSEKCTVGRPMNKCDYIRYFPQSIFSANKLNEQVYIDFSTEDSVMYLGHNYLELAFDCSWYYVIILK